uniref:C-type lectin domain-containing protein n=1 Tax=Echeneis naucrates TaxID=173247 RepID=A0A665UEP5_ECHNA
MISFVFRCSYEQSHFTVALAGKSVGMELVAQRNTPSFVRNPDPTSPRPQTPQPLLQHRDVLTAGQLCLTSDTVTRYAVDSTDKTRVPKGDQFSTLHLTKSWGKANEDCVARGANLVSIHSQEEEEFLSTYTKGSSKWIGLKHNPTEGGYSWSDGTPLSHTNWGSGEPNNHDNREECVEMVSSTNGTISWWNDLNCDAHQDWICMIAKGKNPVIPPVPPSPVPGEMSTSILVLKF